VGYGNPQRQDDGLGPYVVKRVRQALRPDAGVRLAALQQLEPDLVEELRDVPWLIVVDASVGVVGGGWAWEPVAPDLNHAPLLTHHLEPAYLLGLLQAAWGRSPTTWMVAVQGEAFGMGRRLTREARRRGGGAAREIVGFVEAGLNSGAAWHPHLRPGPGVV
jgi:hydrogenase maturation protease